MKYTPSIGVIHLIFNPSGDRHRIKKLANFKPIKTTLKNGNFNGFNPEKSGLNLG